MGCRGSDLIELARYLLRSSPGSAMGFYVYANTILQYSITEKRDEAQTRILSIAIKELIKKSCWPQRIAGPLPATQYRQFSSSLWQSHMDVSFMQVHKATLCPRS